MMAGLRRWWFNFIALFPASTGLFGGKRVFDHKGRAPVAYKPQFACDMADSTT